MGLNGSLAPVVHIKAGVQTGERVANGGLNQFGRIDPALEKGDTCVSNTTNASKVNMAVNCAKHGNDKYRHLAGDEVLRRVGQLIRNAIRGKDLAVRFGGEEIAVFVQGADLSETLALAERIRQSVGQFLFQSKGQIIPVTLSGGVAVHTVGESLDALFSRADKKLYEAKALGRNQIRA